MRSFLFGVQLSELDSELPFLDFAHVFRAFYSVHGNRCSLPRKMEFGVLGCLLLPESCSWGTRLHAHVCFSGCLALAYRVPCTAVYSCSCTNARLSCLFLYPCKGKRRTKLLAVQLKAVHLTVVTLQVQLYSVHTAALSAVMPSLDGGGVRAMMNGATVSTTHPSSACVVRPAVAAASPSRPPNLSAPYVQHTCSL